ncbi:MAG TPA: hypothetical protein VJN93_05085 [Candidatus Acidoferrum sp.]|nr:hypothetical protein [Candidatus Acidoferrum sp.]
MAIIAQVDSNVVRIAGKIAAHSELRNIALVDGRSALSPEFVEQGCRLPPDGWSVQTANSRTKVWIRDKHTLCTLIRFTLTGKEKEAAKEPAISITATFLAEYQLAEGFEPSPAEQKAFMEANAVFNCWPYWREFVKSTTARMNLPPLTLPFFRVLPEKKKDRISSEEKKKQLPAPRREERAQKQAK